MQKYIIIGIVVVVAIFLWQKYGSAVVAKVS